MMPSAAGGTMPELSQAAMDGVCADIEAGVPLKTALLAHEIEPKFIEQVCAVGAGKRVPGFEPSNEVQEQVGVFLRRVRTANARVAAVSAKAILDAGQTVGKSGVREWRALAWWLNNSETTRKEWYEHRSQSIDVQSSLSEEDRRIRAAIAELPMQDVIELASPEFRELL